MAYADAVIENPVTPVTPVTSEHAVLASPPAALQHALFRVLAPVARTAKRRAPVCRRTPARATQAS